MNHIFDQMVSAMDLLNNLMSSKCSENDENDKNKTIEDLMNTFQNQVEIPMTKMSNFVETFIESRSKILRMKQYNEEIQKSNLQLTNGIEYFTKEHERIMKENVNMKKMLKKLQFKRMSCITIPAIPDKKNK